MVQVPLLYNSCNIIKYVMKIPFLETFCFHRRLWVILMGVHSMSFTLKTASSCQSSFVSHIFDVMCDSQKSNSGKCTTVMLFIHFLTLFPNHCWVGCCVRSSLLIGISYIVIRPNVMLSYFLKCILFSSAVHYITV